MGRPRLLRPSRHQDSQPRSPSQPGYALHAVLCEQSGVLASRAGEIVWDVDWPTFELTGGYKLSVTDNGCGMTGPDMVGYINQLSSSGTEQSMSGNYGVGAKIAAATRNREGVIYLSWVGGEGSMIHLWRDPKTGTYGQI